MAVTYSTTVKNLRMEATRGEVANGTLELRDAGNNVLVTYGLDATAGSVTGAVWTLAFDATTVAASGGGAGTNATNAVIKDSGGTAEITGLTVGTSGTDIIIDNQSIATGQDITVVSATITHAA